MKKLWGTMWGIDTGILQSCRVKVHLMHAYVWLSYFAAVFKTEGRRYFGAIITSMNNRGAKRNTYHRDMQELGVLIRGNDEKADDIQ